MKAPHFVIRMPSALFMQKHFFQELLTLSLSFDLSIYLSIYLTIYLSISNLGDIVHSGESWSILWDRMVGQNIWTKSIKGRHSPGNNNIKICACAQ